MVAGAEVTTGRRHHEDLNGLEPDEDQARRITRSVFATRLFQVALVVALVGYAAALMWMIVQMSQEQGAAAQRSTDIRETARLIEDCTSPGGDCFEEAQLRTAEAVRTINLVTIYSTGCVEFQTLSTMDELKTCVDEFLAHDDEAK